MTEIPEHLLKRSKKAKGGASSGDAAAPAPAAANAPVAAAAPTTPAVAAPTAEFPSLDPEPPPAKPDAPYVTASKARKRVPVWAMPVIAAVPIWAYTYAGTMQIPETEDALYVQAAEVYVSCASCHGASGGGGLGYQLSDGEVLATFPDPIDHMAHVARGSAPIAGQAYGANGRTAGDRGVMPAQETLSMLELELVVFHERSVLSSEEENLEGAEAEAYAEWAEELRHKAEAGEDGGPVDVELLLACANPEFTPDATGGGSPDPEGHPCPGPHAAAEGE